MNSSRATVTSAFEPAHRWYLDTSAALKFFADEAESDALEQAILESSPQIFSSTLLETELRRVAVRHPEIAQSEISDFLQSIELVMLTQAAFRLAGQLPGATLRSLDALHLTAALLGGASVIVTYDRRLQAAATNMGLTALAPDQTQLS